MSLIEKIDAEIWKDIAGYDGKYQVSNKGNVVSTNYMNTGKTKPMSIREIGRGYKIVFIRYKTKQKGHLVHRLVAEAFIPNPNNYPQVNHKNEDKNDNTVDNLEWCTAKYNNAYGTRQERWNDKMSHRVIGTNIQTGEKIFFESATEAETQGFDRSFICRCCKGRKSFKTHKGYKWEYAS